MRWNAAERCIELGQYIVEHKETVRGAAKYFGISKSSVHKDVTEKLREVDRILYNDVKKILEENKSQRHLRGGLATKRKYEELSRAKLESKDRKSRGAG